VFQRNFDAHTEGQYASWTAWVAPRTMKPAEAAEQTGMDEAELRSVNKIPAHMLIKAGSTLLVPRSSAKAQDDVTNHVADNAQVTLAPEIVLQRKTVKARKGESVASIAKRYSLSITSVADWNNVSAGSAFKRGSSVVLFLPVRMGRAQTGESSHGKAGRAGKAARHESAKAAKHSGSKKAGKGKKH
jgi:membrane-bound lytic murein transglycosylase D